MSIPVCSDVRRQHLTAESAKGNFSLISERKTNQRKHLPQHKALTYLKMNLEDTE